jgi:hypothetical protein
MYKCITLGVKMPVSKGSVSRVPGSKKLWKFCVTIEGKRIRQSGFTSKQAAEEALMRARSGEKLKPRYKNTAVSFWDHEKLKEMRDNILPISRSFRDAMAKAEKKWGYVTSLNQFRRCFKRKFGVHAKNYLGLEKGIVEATSEVPPKLNPIYLNKVIKSLEGRLEKTEDALIDALNLSDVIKYEIRGLKNVTIKPPEWLFEVVKGAIHHGVPTLFLSDIHHGEVVFADQVDGLNHYDMRESRVRLERIFTKTTFLLDQVLSNADYPGIVLALGGDHVTGIIHEELRETNAMPIFPIIIDLVEVLTSGIKLLKKRYRRVFIPSIVGNHGRLDRKPRKKNGPQDNFEYILMHMLAARFDKDPDVTIIVPESFDYSYKIYNTRYLLTHGDKFRGGSGISGPILPWTLGEHRQRKQKQAAETWSGQPHVYDIMIMGHWHRYFPADGAFLVNGSVKGFDEYASSISAPFEPPKQALWLTNPRYGKTIAMPVYAVKKPAEYAGDWVSVFERA